MDILIPPLEQPQALLGVVFPVKTRAVEPYAPSRSSTVTGEVVGGVGCRLGLRSGVLAAGLGGGLWYMLGSVHNPGLVQDLNGGGMSNAGLCQEGDGAHF